MECRVLAKENPLNVGENEWQGALNTTSFAIAAGAVEPERRALTAPVGRRLLVPDWMIRGCRGSNQPFSGREWFG